MPNVGDPIYAADFPQYARLASDVTLTTSSTTFQNVTGLSVSVVANATYVVECVFFAANAAGTTEDIRYGFTYPTGATMRGGVMGGTTGGVSAAVASDMNLLAGNITSGSTAFSVGLSTSSTMTIIRATLLMSTTSGTFQVQAAQDTSGTNASKVQTGSHIILTPVG